MPRADLKLGQPANANWRAINTVSADLAAVERTQRAHAAAISRLDRRTGYLTAGHHPFRIYSLPSRLRETPDADGWRKFRVRAGLVGDVEVTGTDGADADPWSDSYPDVFAGDEFTVDDAIQKYYVWIEVTDDDTSIISAEIKHGLVWPPATPTDKALILIGYIDTWTGSETSQAAIRQIITEDFSPAVVLQVCLPSGDAKIIARASNFFDITA